MNFLDGFLAEKVFELNSSFCCVICSHTVPLHYLRPIMSPKRPASSPASGKEPKRQEKVMALHEKVELLDMVKEGKSYAALRRHCGVNTSIVRYIKKNDKTIRSSIA